MPTSPRGAVLTLAHGTKRTLLPTEISLLPRNDNNNKTVGKSESARTLSENQGPWRELSISVIITFIDDIAHWNDAEVHDQEVNDEDDVLAADNFDSGHASPVSTSVNISLPFVFSFFRGRIRDGHNVPSENVCHMSGIQSHIPEIIVALSDRVQVRVRRISGVFSPIPDIWHTFSLGTSWPSRFRPQKQHLSTP